MLQFWALMFSLVTTQRNILPGRSSASTLCSSTIGNAMELILAWFVEAADAMLKRTNIRQQIVAILLGEFFLERWHLAFAILENRANLRCALPRLGLLHLAVEAGT